MKISFEGIASSNGDYFCWAVDIDTYRKLTGKEPIKHYFSDLYDLYDLYPDDILGFQQLMNKLQKTIKS